MRKFLKRLGSSEKRMKMRRGEKLMGLFFSLLLLAGCEVQSRESTQPVKDEALTIWWTRSYYAQEDDALKAAIAQWQEQTGNKVNLSLISQDDILKDTEQALESGNPPDIVFSPRVDFTLTPRWAWDDRLVDVSEVIEPLKDKYSPAALDSVALYNNVLKKRSTYAVPIKQQTVHVHYWRDLLAEAGLREADIPREWDAFWDFWKQARDNLRRQGREDIYSFGFPLSSEGTDTHFAFEQILDAYDVKILDEEGNFSADDPQIRRGIAAALQWFASLYEEGYVPPDAPNWINSDNNANFLNQRVLMTINPSLSIPGSQREEEEIYRDRLATIELPDEPDGESPRYVVTVKQVAIFKSAPHPEMAKDFLAYFIQPERLSPYLEGSFGRFFPVMPEIAAEPFWRDPRDPHISVAAQQFQNENTRPGYQSLNPAYAEVQSENIWGVALESVVVDGISPEAAADEALSRIGEIFAAWKR